MPKKYIHQQSSADMPFFSHRSGRKNKKFVCLETLFLGNKNEVRKLSGLFPQEITPIGVVETIWDIERLPEDISPRLVVALDSFGEGISFNLLQQIRARLNSPAMICLVESISQEKEIELRSVGLIFMGSRNIFLAHAREIVEGVSKSQVGFRPGMCR